MTRPSKRELERAIEELNSEDSSTPGESFVSREYSEPVATAVHTAIRKVIRDCYDEPIANAREPALAFLASLRETHGIDEIHDDAVLATLRKRAEDVDSHHWGPVDAFQAAIGVAPRLLEADDRERFDDAVAAGDDETVTTLSVHAVYDWLAQQPAGPEAL